MTRVMFTLFMPNRASWNGRWSGEGRNYTITRHFTDREVRRLADQLWWFYSFGDGWGATIEAEILGPGERRKKSDGFCGYDWMVDSIIQHGDIRRPAQDMGAHLKPGKVEAMTINEHKQRHADLHRALDELVADMISHTEMLPSTTTVVELMKWANEQIDDPTPEQARP